MSKLFVFFCCISVVLTICVSPQAYYTCSTPNLENNRHTFYAYPGETVWIGTEGTNLGPFEVITSISTETECFMTLDRQDQKVILDNLDGSCSHTISMSVDKDSLEVEKTTASKPVKIILNTNDANAHLYKSTPQFTFIAGLTLFYLVLVLISLIISAILSELLKLD